MIRPSRASSLNCSTSMPPYNHSRQITQRQFQRVDSYCGKYPPKSTPTNKTDGKSSQKAVPRDPNDKLAPTGYGEAKFVAADDLLAYKVRFENESDATAPAHIITVTDTLSDNADLSTFELTEISFANHTLIVPKGLNHYETTLDLSPDGTNLLCLVNASLDMATRTITCTLTGIDPQTGWLPKDIMKGILYPNDSTGRGEGFVSYVVKPKTGLPTGTQITNNASITFDWNDPIDTPLVLNTLERGRAHQRSGGTAGRNALQGFYRRLVRRGRSGRIGRGRL